MVSKTSSVAFASWSINCVLAVTSGSPLVVTLLGGDGVDLFLEGVRRERLHDVVVDAGAERLDNVVLGGVGRDHQDRRLFRLVLAAQGPDEVDAVHLGHVPVRDD